MTKDDKEQLELLRTRAKETAEIIRKLGYEDLANSLLFNVGYAVGLAHRLDKEHQEIQLRLDAL